MKGSATPQEEKALRDDMRRGETPGCPHCGTRLTGTPVPPRPDVSYVRDRVILNCSSCDFRVVLDTK
jgi:hypothetical protein